MALGGGAERLAAKSVLQGVVPLSMAFKMLTQLNPPIPLYLPEKGSGQAIAVIDYGPEHHLIWVTALDANGEIWCAPNPQVRLQGNWTMRRESSAPKKGSLRAVIPDDGELEVALLAEGKPC